MTRLAIAKSPPFDEEHNPVLLSSFSGQKAGDYVLDWFTGDVGVDASKLSLDHIYEVSRYGEKIYDIEKWLKVDGSYMCSIQLRRGTPRLTVIDWYNDHSIPCPSTVAQISGNPTKFLQGQNCYGPRCADLQPLLMSLLASFPADLGLAPADVPIHARRLDVTTMIELDSHNRVHDWLRQAADRSRSRHGRPLVSGTTVYWGSKNGWGIKAYCKSCELQAHPFADLNVNGEFQHCVESQLRLELTLRTRELKLHDLIDESLIWTYFDRVELGMMKRNDLLNGGDLPTSSLMVYRAWLSGYPVDVDLKRRQFYAHRRRILDEVGVDISTSPQGILERQAQGVMDREYLKAHEVQAVPDVFAPFMWRPFAASDLAPSSTDSRVPAQIA